MIVLRLSTATLLLGIALSAVSLSAVAQDAAGTAAKPTIRKSHKTAHAAKKHVARHESAKPNVERTPPAEPAPVSSKDIAAPVADHPPNEFHFGDVDATVHGDLNIGVGGRTH